MRISSLPGITSNRYCAFYALSPGRHMNFTSIGENGEPGIVVQLPGNTTKNWPGSGRDERLAGAKA